MPVTLVTFYHIDIPGIINLCFYHIVALHIIVYVAIVISVESVI